MTPMETSCLVKIYRRIDGHCGWESLDDFIIWAEQQKYHTNLVLYKRNDRKPHGPDNSYFYKKFAYEDRVVCSFCAECDKKTAQCEQIGCKEYRGWFVNNWNLNICIKPKKPVEEPVAVRIWQYPHPHEVNR